MQRRLKTVAVISNARKFSRERSLALQSVNLTQRQFYYEVQKLEKNKQNGERQAELSQRKSTNHITEEQKNFIRNFGESFKGKFKYENFKDIWRNKFNLKPVSKATFYRYTTSEKRKLLDEMNNIKIGF